jgi:hypothetical protein
MNISAQNNLLKMALDEGCKTIGELARFLKTQPSTFIRA